MTPLMFIFM